MDVLMHSILFCFLASNVLSDFNVLNRLVIIILSQPNSYHENLALQKQTDILNQLTSLYEGRHRVLISPKDFHDVPGHWTVIPLFERLAKYREMSWFVFIEDSTEMNVFEVLKTLSIYDHSLPYFLGYALEDREPTIIHHFDSTDDDERLSYPHFSTGFAITLTLLKKALARWTKGKELGFSIDPKYELSKYLHKYCDDARLSNDSHFCMVKNTRLCATWIPGDFPSCGPPVPKGQVIFAVKTCQKYHRNRAQVVKSTWGPETENIAYFSDVDDPSIPTVRLGIENVAHGHCEKTMSIIRHIESSHDHELQWLVIADDDTLFSIYRLLQLLSCYNSSERIAIGERYGYGTTSEQGYDYVTGGAGMVFSMPTVKELASSCVCPSLDSPDDMIIGMCLKRNGIPVLHSPYFHQARPKDYDINLLLHQKPVSFHKHWMIDPYEVYRSWLQDPKTLHLEL